MQPKISIITPTFNSETKIEECLLSVAIQTYQNIEHLIIDNLSTDTTLDIVTRYQAIYPSIRLVSEKDEGIYYAMNKGIKLAEGEWLFFLGSDDALFNKNVLFSLMPYLRNSKLDVIYGNVIFSVSGEKYDGKFTKFKLLTKNICHQSIFVRKSVFNITGYFNIEYKALADWHFNMKWFNNKSIKRKYINEIIARYYEDGYCYNNPDIKFSEHWEQNVKNYFPWLIRFIYFNQNRAFLRLFWDA